MPLNLTNRLLESHRVRAAESDGEIALKVDQCLLQDATGTMACLQYLEMGDEPVRVPMAVQYVDHNMLQIDFKNADDHRFLRSFCARYGMVYSPPGNGICHYVHTERFARPGELLIGADSHTTTSGALGMIAVGAGGVEVAVALTGRPFEMELPKVVGVELKGTLSPWVQPKDVILELLRRRGVRGGEGPDLRVLWRRGGRHRGHRPGHHLQHDRRAGGHDGHLPVGRAHPGVAPGTGAGGSVVPPGSRAGL